MSRRKVMAILVALIVLVTGAAVGAAAYFGLIFTSPSVANPPAVKLPTNAVSTVAKGLAAPWGLAFLVSRPRVPCTAMVSSRCSRRRSPCANSEARWREVG